jgi:hypothetical protein
MRDAGKPGAGQSRYPGYDVLSKRFGPSWNEHTWRVIEHRLSIKSEPPRFFTPAEFETVVAIGRRIVPQPTGRPTIPIAALVDDKLHRGVSDGYQVPGMPREGDAWRLGLKALNAEAEAAHSRRFHELAESHQDCLLQHMQDGALNAPEWGNLRPSDFFQKRMARDIVLAYYAHPTAWSEIGWGGPASPRGYVRLGFDERDSWEAAEARDGHEVSALRINRDVR